MFFNRNKLSFMDIGLQTDVHCHILPALDDGAGSIEVSLQILERLHNAGVRRVVFTPHVSVMFPNNVTSIETSYNSLLSSLPDELKEMQFGLASEYMIDEGFNPFSDFLFTYKDKSILVEMSYFSKSDNIFEVIFELIQLGYNPIVAHPERYTYYFPGIGKVKALDDLEKLRDMGCSFQLNVQSLSGAYGTGSLKILKYMLDNDFYTYIATDIHSPAQLNHFTDFRISSGQMEKVRQLAVNNDGLF